MTVLPIRVAGMFCVGLALAGCSVAGIKPLPGSGTATAAIASFAPAAPTPAGHVPDAAAVPTASDDVLLGYVGTEHGKIDGLIAHYSEQYDVPERLVRRVITRESGYNPAARNGPYYGLMQISHATARGMGFSGSPSGLLDAETNLRFAVRYLAGAYVTANGNEDLAMRYFAQGYYYDAKRQGLLDKSGLR